MKKKSIILESLALFILILLLFGCDSSGGSGVFPVSTAVTTSNGIIDLSMVTVIPSGSEDTFIMGDPTAGDTSYVAPHYVTLSIPYAIEDSEFTNEQAAAVFNWALGQGYELFGLDNSNNKLIWNDLMLYYFGSSNQLDYADGVITVRAGFEDYPCTNLSIYGMIVLCYFLNDIYGYEQTYDLSEGFSSCNYTAKGFRMPTEAEWEYAARGGSKAVETLYAGSDVLTDVAWTQGNCQENGENSDFTSGLGTNPVKKRTPNELGIYDMSGNIAERVGDIYEAYTAASVTNPTGAAPDSSYIYVYRGGSWLTGADHGYTVFRRDRGDARGYGGNIGFRPVQVLQ